MSFLQMKLLEESQQIQVEQLWEERDRARNLPWPSHCPPGKPPQGSGARVKTTLPVQSDGRDHGPLLCGTPAWLTLFQSLRAGLSTLTTPQQHATSFHPPDVPRWTLCQGDTISSSLWFGQERMPLGRCISQKTDNCEKL